MKILRVIGSMAPSVGGPAQGLRNLIPALERLGIQNEVVSCDVSDAPWKNTVPFPLHPLGPGKYGYSYSSRIGPWLEKNLSRFDAVIAHGLWLWPGLAAFRVWKKLAPARTRFLVMPHGMLDPWFQRAPSRRFKAVRNHLYWRLLERHVVNGADAVLFTCEEELQLARETFAGYLPRREINAGYGVPNPPPFHDSMRMAFQATCSALKERPYLLFLGRIHPKKGIELLANAFSKLPANSSLDLVIAGPGWETSYGQRLSFEIGSCQKIHVVGMLEGSAKWGALHGCQAFVLPSHQENFGIAVVEALACDKPVLISNKVNIWREILRDEAGMVANDTIDDTASMLQAFAGAGGEKAPGHFYQCYKRHFGIESAASRLARILNDSQTW